MGLWIDTDMGFDDLVAVLVVIHAGKHIDGMSLIAGNSPLERVRINAASAARQFDWDFKIYTGRETAVMGGLETAERILGPLGMQSSGVHLPDCRPIAECSAFEGLCNWLESKSGPDDERHILALGPLGNIASLVLARPDLARKIDCVTWMGGAVTRGNHTALAEYNAFADPEAVAITLSHQVQLRMVDLDLCRQVLGTPDDVAPIRKAGGKNAELLADLSEGYINIALSRGRDAMAIFDPCAAVAVIDQDAISFADAHIEVDTSHGPSRGKIIVAPHPTAIKNAQYAVSVDTERARDLIFSALKAEAAK
ncbi:nucleoside hydrolase [Thalassospira xiamenensis]|uniref:Inosine-uridine nucleoside N-ribohydrolase n=1 Tax=Thalassospira xiamenensis TaxID=220697 RepID=A0A285RR19_9PROT|nr:nucleoside hydrolase [Thalassospira xiamenensis]SOB96490.1 Inosine-uridine nucleoside N-ribohydrolase [Thalassospira xiamenensis]